MHPTPWLIIDQTEIIQFNCFSQMTKRILKQRCCIGYCWPRSIWRNISIWECVWSFEKSSRTEWFWFGLWWAMGLDASCKACSWSSFTWAGPCYRSRRGLPTGSGNFQIRKKRKMLPSKQHMVIERSWRMFCADETINKTERNGRKSICHTRRLRRDNAKFRKSCKNLWRSHRNILLMCM